MTVWPSGLRRWLQAPVRKGVGSNPTAVIIIRLQMHEHDGSWEGILGCCFPWQTLEREWRWLCSRLVVFFFLLRRGGPLKGNLWNKKPEGQIAQAEECWEQPCVWECCMSAPPRPSHMHGWPWQDSNLQSLVPKTNALSIRPQGRLFEEQPCERNPKRTMQPCLWNAIRSDPLVVQEVLWMGSQQCYLKPTGETATHADIC